jgi:NAD(P)-dependent dehydrogenase (short-subunit alcohol dehydrogenase family)
MQKMTNCEVLHETLDVTDSGTVTSSVTAIWARPGRLGICVTNSGGPPSNLFKNTPPEAWRYALDQLLMSTFILQGKLCRRCSRTSEDF